MEILYWKLIPKALVKNVCNFRIKYFPQFSFKGVYLVQYLIIFHKIHALMVPGCVIIWWLCCPTLSKHSYQKLLRKPVQWLKFLFCIIATAQKWGKTCIKIKYLATCTKKRPKLLTFSCLSNRFCLGKTCQFVFYLTSTLHK